MRTYLYPPDSIWWILWISLSYTVTATVCREISPLLLKQGYPNLKVLITCLLLVQEVCKVKPTYRKSWGRFDLGALLQGQTKIPKLRITLAYLLLVLEVCNVKPTYRKPWARNLLVWSDVTLGPSFKVKLQ